MGNAQKKPHDVGARRGSADKYKVKAEGGTAAAESRKNLANGNNSTAQLGNGRPDSSVEKRTDLNFTSGALTPPLAQLKNEGNQFFKNGQFGDALEKYTQAITGFTEAGTCTPILIYLPMDLLLLNSEPLTTLLTSKCTGGFYNHLFYS